ncbi:S-layer homology domain-containing protein [Oscillatoria acuminata]|uniref:WD40 repeat-containing protein n=1 Tax=Oscillatoria acuminata PCC 6304 TaxID=56110 RepID=K9TC06_9CYAN|nr:S-layer homology domain-containing protein [Oscillatoria acuminata]AFY79948.1 WD40 repeat-containing protein [Oscillatoria acuminata PCC 6304]
MKGWQKFQGPRLFRALGVALGETPVTPRLRPRDPIRVLTVVFGLMLPVGMMESAEAQSTYTDITNHWARTCIETLAERDILAVFSSETFRPEDPIQRVEFASVVRKAFPNVEPVRDPIEFIDLPTDYWGREIVQDAYRSGFISPYSGRAFNPTQVIPRWQAIALLTTGLRYKSPENGLEMVEASLADWEGIPDYARGAIAAGIQNRLVVNYPDPRTLNPTEPLSRGELASMICQVQEDIGAIALVPQQYVASPDAIATAETPTAETPTAETPTAETPTVETPTAETPTAETPTPPTPIAAGNQRWQTAVLTNVLNFQPTGITPDSQVEQCVTDTSGTPRCESISASMDATAIAIDGQGFVMASGHRGADLAPINLWDLRTGDRIRTLEGHRGRVGALAIAPNGQWALSGGGDGEIKIWDIRTGTLTQTLTGHTNEVTGLEIASNGNTAISSSRDRTVKLWDLNTGEVLRTLEDRQTAMLDVAVSSDGRMAASSSEDGLVRLWNLQSGELIRTISADINAVRTLAFSPNGQTLATGGEGTIRLWNIANGDLVRTIARNPEATFFEVAFSNDGETLVGTVQEGDISAIRIWDVRTGALLHFFPTAAAAIALTPDGQTLVGGGWDIKIWRMP